ncbi:MAG: thioredoxin, partial [Chloroflexi bacterium]|nr:thioredoxin [Chloroflexota bacterium]
FEQSLKESDRPVLVDFWGPHCAPCVRLEPILAELAGEYDDKVHFFKMNVDKNPTTTGKYLIRGIPTIIIFKGGKPMHQLLGYRPKREIKHHLDRVLS